MNRKYKTLPAQYASQEDIQYTDLFAYSWEVLNLAGLGTSSVDVTILAESDFLAEVGVGSIYNQVSKAHIEYQDISVLITDSGSGRQLMDRAVQFRHWFGHPQEPFYFPTPKLFSANSVITILFTELDNVAVDIYGTMFGRKIFRR